jgi:hypothetical protein
MVACDKDMHDFEEVAMLKLRNITKGIVWCALLLAPCSDLTATQIQAEMPGLRTQENGWRVLADLDSLLDREGLDEALLMEFLRNQNWDTAASDDLQRELAYGFVTLVGARVVDPLNTDFTEATMTAHFANYTLVCDTWAHLLQDLATYGHSRELDNSIYLVLSCVEPDSQDGFEGETYYGTPDDNSVARFIEYGCISLESATAATMSGPRRSRRTDDWLLPSLEIVCHGASRIQDIDMNIHITGYLQSWLPLTLYKQTSNVCAIASLIAVTCFIESESFQTVWHTDVGAELLATVETCFCQLGVDMSNPRGFGHDQQALIKLTARFHSLIIGDWQHQED